MQNYESFSTDETPLKKRHFGREMVPVESALEAQRQLILYMAPLRIKQLITEMDHVDLEEALTMLYMEKYVLGEHNGFAEYCDENEDDQLFMNRVINKSLIESDLEAMKIFIEEMTGPLFEDELEIDNFVKENSH